jgi:uncharacterized protein (TIGR02118 family)
MHRLLVRYPKPSDPDRFLDHYVKRHVPLARSLPGLIDCRYVLPKALGPDDGATFLLFEADFADEAAMFEALGSPVGSEVAADVPNYSPAGATLVHYDVPGS